MSRAKCTVLQLARRFLPVHRYKDAVSMDEVGVPSDLAGALSHHRGRLVILRSLKRYHDAVLHELCHALCGPSSLSDEAALMGLQWAFMQQLKPRDYHTCRQAWADYALSDGEIGYGDAFLSEAEWGVCVAAATRERLITKRGLPCANLKVHPGWERYLRVRHPAV